MKKPKGHGTRMSDEDHAIWQGVASSLEPLKGAKSRVIAGPQTSDPGTRSAVPHPARKSAAHGTHSSEDHSARRVREMLEHPPIEAPPPLADFCKRKERKISRGREEIEARLDLHGMRQVEAHIALRRFLVSCYEKGHRTVLVITGKGAPGRQRDDEHGFLGRPETGVLRRNVPMWLAEPQLRQIVVSFTSAAVHHGGDGALYIHLRRPGRG